MARRDELRRRLGGELKDLLRFQADASTGDSADLAFDSGSEEVTSQLAELESRELTQIERALARLKQGTYGVCEGCQKKIPVARLNALPFSTTCIECQREMEMYGRWGGGAGAGNWEKVSEAEAPLEEQRDIDLSDIELDLSTNR
jgi:DnaK suppressor protein